MREYEGVVPLKEINDRKHICLKCLNLQVDKRSENLDCTCKAFTEFCFQWDKNIGKNPWILSCFGMITKENDMLDMEDEIYRYSLRKIMEKGKSEAVARNQIVCAQRSAKLNSSQLVGLKELYYSETHPPLAGPPKNESCGTACKVIKKNPLLDGEMSGKSWKGVGAIDMSTYDSIEENKRKKREEAKLAGTEDKTKDLTGARRVANGGKGKTTKTTDTTVITKDIAKTRRGLRRI